MLIVGVDPGTTVGYAALSDKGEIIKVGSRKELSLDKLTALVRELGRPLIVSCDKGKPPSFVEKFSIKVGARLHHPKEDLRAVEKREEVKAHSSLCANSHELDALASGLIAYKKFRPLIARTRRTLEKLGKSDVFESVLELVVRRGVHIKGALELVQKGRDRRLVSKIKGQAKVREADIVHLYNRCVDLKEEVSSLKDSLKSANREKRKLQSRAKKFARKASKILPEEKLRELKGFKEERLQFLEQELERVKGLNAELESKREELYSLLEGCDRLVVAKRLRNLGWTEVQRKGLRLRKGDVLFIDDANEFSEKALKKLKSKVDIIVSGKRLSKKVRSRLLEDFTVLAAKDIALELDERFAFINKESFHKARKDEGLLRQIVEEYKSKRR